ncbi:MAG: hypothetical protein NXY57DRAFT_973661 [Lentinula lateritia]|nr:MAG: hypothetical protein NXY57DRAFT_973661 [Lentinula lateritia]
MPRYDLKMIPDQLGLDQEFSESLEFTIKKFPPPSMPMPPTVLDCMPLQMKQFEKSGKLIIKGKVDDYLSECLGLNANDCFVTTGSRVFVNKGVPLLLSRLAAGRLSSPKLLRLAVRMFFVRVGQGASEYSHDKIRHMIVRYFEEWNGLYSRWAPTDLDDVAVGTPGSAARRREKRTVAPYRSYEVEESLEMVPSLPTTPEASEPRNQITPGKEETPRKRERYSTRFVQAPSYRSFAVDELELAPPMKNTKRAASECPPSPSQRNKRFKISTNDFNLNGSYGVKSSLKPLKMALTKIRGSKAAK